LQDIQNQLQKMAGKLTPQAELDLQLQGQRKQRDAQRKTEDLQADVDARRNDTLQKAGAQMSAVIRKLAEEKGIDVVVDVANTLYFKPTLDLTDEAIAAFDAAYPVQ
jgi:outer membrane protein